MWDNAHLYESLVQLATEQGVKNGKVLWPVRIALTGLAATPGGASEIAEIIGKEETLRQIRTCRWRNSMHEWTQR